MDTVNKRKELQEEIAELTALIEEWSAERDSETLWAIYLLETCIERRRHALRELPL